MLPLIEQLPASVTPFQSSSSFLAEPHFIFLDSGVGYSRLGRYSYVTADPFLVLRSKGTNIQIIQGDEVSNVHGNPFDWLKKIWAELRSETVPNLPPFQGGVAGYFGYDLCHQVERLPRSAVDDLELPEMYVGFYDWVVSHDNLSGETWIVATGGTERSVNHARERMNWVKQRLKRGWKPCFDIATNPQPCKTAFRSNFTREDYIQAIKTAKEYIAAGEIYQVNLSQRFETELTAHPWQLYSRLRQVNSAPFAAYLGFDDVTIISASPEQFLKVEGRSVETRPIKGTRPRGKTLDEDQALAKELMNSIKDRAENVMIVDLLRNDIGKVCRIGSVHVPELVILEEYPTVHHLVSTVAGELDERYTSIDLLRACFPGGSVTGCPKIRSMEIIDELEPAQRGAYCGAIGYIGFDGSMNTNIVIRTLTVKDGRVYFQVGGGIVADSDPEAEYQETLDKAYASMLALETVQVESIQRRCDSV